MKNKKTLIIIPIILIILLLIGVGGFVFVYFKTDMFKSPKNLFFKYAGKSFETVKDFDYDEFLEDYKSISEKSYKSNGEINVEVSTDIDEAKEIVDMVNKAKLNYNFNTIPKEEKSSFTVSAIYDNTEITKFEGLANNDNYGLKCSDLYEKYIYVENNNLQALAKKFGINSSSIPDKIKKIDTYDLLYVSKDTRKKIKDTYYNLLKEKLNNRNFTVNKNVDTTVNGEILKTNSYSLELTEAETYDILISLLETLKNDNTTLDLIVEKAEKSNFKDSYEQSINYSNYSSYFYDYSNTETVTFDKEYLKEQIQKAIDDLNEEKSSTSEDNKLKITIYSYKGNTVKLELNVTNSDELNNATVEITNNKNSNNIISFNIDGKNILKIDYTKTKENSTEKLVGTATITSNSITVPINFNIESSKKLIKTNIKATLPVEDVLGTSQETFTEDIVIEFNSETSGELGKGTNNNISYLSISSGNNLAKLNFKLDTIYTDDISIADLNSSNGVNLNTMSVSEIETTFKDIVINFRNVLPNKLKLLGIDLPFLTTDEDTAESYDETYDYGLNENNNFEEQEDNVETTSTNYIYKH